MSQDLPSPPGTFVLRLGGVLDGPVVRPLASELLDDLFVVCRYVLQEGRA